MESNSKKTEINIIEIGGTRGGCECEDDEAAKTWALCFSKAQILLASGPVVTYCKSATKASRPLCDLCAFVSCASVA